MYLPSPPHAPFGVTTTSLQASVCMLYTRSFRGFPSWASIRVKKSSDWKSAIQNELQLIFQRFVRRYSFQQNMSEPNVSNKALYGNESYILQHLICPDDVVTVWLKPCQCSR